MKRKPISNPPSGADFLAFMQEEARQEPCEITRAPIKGWIQFAFWGLRIYIVVMLLMVAIGFVRGMN
ncbi:hypothetical protein BI364_02115 [Acidihalobacter yilgarnensis]|uniref:Uncharacterized protein n=1 Tax=Acidihalobacter yilgarnensis TaxID=2819280 RepID=A0A1D8IKH3_9GAMM|nr:hypothetical protein [Acidihalobacter yilgarnensis]AOU96962.1 hypothetical protein BI364_02115 [Acidihalobacter yilgarnensis]